MSNVIVVIIGASELRDKLTKLQDKALIQAALTVGGNTLKRIMAEYPPASHRPQAFKSDKSRRYFLPAQYALL